MKHSPAAMPRKIRQTRLRRLLSLLSQRSRLSPDRAVLRSQHRLRQSQVLAHKEAQSPLRQSQAPRSHPPLRRSQVQGPLRLPPNPLRQHQSQVLAVERPYRNPAKVRRSPVRMRDKAMRKNRASARPLEMPCHARCLSLADHAAWLITHFPRVAGTIAPAHAPEAPRASAAATVPPITAVVSAAAEMKAAITVRAARNTTKARVVDVVRRLP